MTNLVTQTTSRPTRKMAAVGVSGVITTVLAGFLVQSLPGLSEACSNELGGVLVAVGAGGLVTVTNFVAGYLRRERL